MAMVNPRACERRTRTQDLENRYGRFMSIEGSNLSPSARESEMPATGQLFGGNSDAGPRSGMQSRHKPPVSRACRLRSRSHADRTTHMRRLTIMAGQGARVGGDASSREAVVRRNRD